MPRFIQYATILAMTEAARILGQLFSRLVNLLPTFGIVGFGLRLCR